MCKKIRIKKEIAHAISFELLCDMAEGNNVSEELREIYESVLPIPIPLAVTPLPSTPKKKRVALQPKQLFPSPSQKKKRGKSMAYLLDLQKKKSEETITWNTLREQWIRESTYPVKYFDMTRKALNFDNIKEELGFQRFSLRGKYKLITYMVTFLVNLTQRCIIVADNSTLQDDYFSLQWGLPKDLPEERTLRSMKKEGECTLVSLPRVPREIKNLKIDQVRCVLDSIDRAQVAPSTANYVLIAKCKPVQIELFPDQLFHDLYGWEGKCNNQAILPDEVLETMVTNDSDASEGESVSETEEDTGDEEDSEENNKEN